MARRVFGGNSGYVGYSKSRRAVEAEHEGKRNISNMDKEFLDAVVEYLKCDYDVMVKKMSLSALKKFCKEISPNREWHYTSMYGNKTQYYDPQDVASDLYKWMGCINQGDRAME